MDKISIIIPIHNESKNIDKLISKLLKQTYSNIEIVCVPNNCTDNSIEKLEYWRKKDSRIKIYINKIKGLTLARKRGVFEATGTYITFIDADDYYADDKAIEKMHAQMIKDNVQICEFAHFVKPMGLPLVKKYVSATTNNTILNREELLAGPAMGAFIGRGGTFSGYVWNKMYSSDILKDAVKQIPHSVIQQEDLYFNAYAFTSKLVQRVSSNTEAFYVYNTGVGVSSSSDTGISILRDYRYSKLDIEKIIEKEKLGDDYLLRLWSETLFCYKAAIQNLIRDNIEKPRVIALIDEVESYKYINHAKRYFSMYREKQWCNELGFMSSDYSVEEYYDWCKTTLPRMSNKQIAKAKVKRVLCKLLK